MRVPFLFGSMLLGGLLLFGGFVEVAGSVHRLEAEAGPCVTSRLGGVTPAPAANRQTASIGVREHP